MANLIRIVFITVVLLVGAPLSAIAGPCDAYFSFDGNLNDTGGNGYDGEMIGAKGTSAKANYTEGKFGKALELDGTGAMRALIDLHWDGCPQVTVSAWIKVARDAPDITTVLFSTGQSSGPGLYVTTNYLKLNGTENGVYQPNAVRPGSWMFVAGAYNYETGVYKLHWSSRDPKPGKLSQHRGEPENAFWIGTENDGWGSFISGVAVDELRITGAELSKEDVMAMRASSPTTTTTVASAIVGSPDQTQQPGSASAGDLSVDTDRTQNQIGMNPPTSQSSDPIACDAQADCPGGNYCAVDNVCYSNSQLPKDYAAATASTGDPGRPGLGTTGQIPVSLIPDLDGDTTSDSDGSSSRPGLGDSNPNPTPGADMITDLSAGQVMAGRWVYVVDASADSPIPDFVQSLPHTTLKFFGRDNGLSGTVSSHSGGISDESLTSVSKIGRTVSLSSASYGSWSGQVAEGGGSMSLHSTDPRTPPRSFVKYSDSAEPETSSSANSSDDPDSEGDDIAWPIGTSVRHTKLHYDTGVLRSSGVSGGVGDRAERTVFSTNYRFPYWIETRENYDKPCTVYVHAREVSTASDDSNPLVVEYDVCDGGLWRINPLTTLSRALRNPEAGDFHPITGIEVCNNGINNRVKGIRARARSIPGPDGQYTSNYSDVEFEQRINCVEWQSMAHCPPSTFAIGLKLHFRDGDIGSPRDFLSGLELICSGVYWMESGSFGSWVPIQ